MLFKVKCINTAEFSPSVQSKKQLTLHAGICILNAK